MNEFFGAAYVKRNIFKSKVKPRNSAKFGQPDFVRYCGVLRYLAGSLSHPENHSLKFSLNVPGYVYFH